MTRDALLLAVLLVYFCYSLAEAKPADVAVHVDIPYNLTAATGESRSGSTVKALVAVENTGPTDRVVQVAVNFPAGFVPIVIPDGWQATAGRIAGDVRLPGGYGQWFELLAFDTGAMVTGEYPVAITVDDGVGATIQHRTVTVGRQAREAGKGLVIEKVELPVDRFGYRDERQHANTLILRDRALDYYKSVLKGKGAYNDVAEAVHPLAHMNVAFVNPAGAERLLLVTARLLDRNGRPVAGMFTPAASIDDREIGGFSGGKEGTEAFIALSGAVSQTVCLPIYIDEGLLSGGQYAFVVSVREEGREVAKSELPVTVIARDGKAATVTLIAVGLVASGVLAAGRCRRLVLGGLKTRWLITITLFGAASFAAVNVPATLLNDVLHALLGPLAFLVTGMFHGVILYMLLAALVVLIPRPGVITLLLTVRLLLGVLAFGHASPVALLLYGSQAVLLEAALYLAGITIPWGKGAADAARAGRGRRDCLLFAVVCGLADGICTYLNIQSLSFLYRFFYADWYIAAAVAINGFLYSGIGGYFGVVLGDKLRTVGSD